MEKMTEEDWKRLYELLLLCFPGEEYADRRKDWEESRKKGEER